MTRPAFMAIDPGDTTGWATFDEKGNGTGFGQVTTKNAKDIHKFLDEHSPEVIILEDYELFPWKTQQMAFNTVQTVRRIGNIESWAMLNEVPIHLQKPNVKTIGYMWAGIQKPKNHAQSHGPDAYVHGVHFLQKAGIRKPQQGVAKSDSGE